LKQKIYGSSPSKYKKLLYVFSVPFVHKKSGI
jgi:hypothetical protein